MQITRQLTPHTTVTVEGKTVVEVFEQLAQLEEIFADHETCWLCGQVGVRYQVRNTRGFKFYAAVCLGCGAEFTFGVRKTPPGILFPQLRDASGRLKANGGWIQPPRKQDAGPPATNGKPASSPAAGGSLNSR